MSDEWYVPDRYLLPERSGLIVPSRIAARIFAMTDLGRQAKNARGDDPEFDAVISAMATTSARWRTSVRGSKPAQPAEAKPLSEWMTTSEVAERLNVTSSRVRQECRAGRLRAENQGPRLGWRINREDFEHYRAARAA